MKRKVKLYFLSIIIIFSLFSIPQVKASTEYTFEDDVVGAVPAGWIDSSSGSCSARVSDDVAHGGTKSVKIIDSNNNGWSILDIQNQFDEEEMTLWTYMVDYNRILAVYTYENGIGSDLLAIVSYNNDNKIYAWNGITMTEIYAGYEKETWKKMQIIHDFENNTFDVYINYILEADDFDFYGGEATSFKSCRFMTGKSISSGVQGYIDDIWIGEEEIAIEPPDDPELLFGAGFNTSNPYVELHWNHTLINVEVFEVQNSSDGISFDYLGNTTTANYTDTQVFNGTIRYYRVRACNYTDGSWYNSSFSNINMEKVYFIPEIGNGTPSEDYAGLFIVGLIIGLIIGIGASRS